MREKILLILLILIICTALPLMYSCDSQTVMEPVNGTNYVALGDSIATGYGLEDYKKEKKKVKDSYVNLFAAEENLSVTNLAVNGMSSGEMRTYLEYLDIRDEDGKKAIEEANLITISIGGNDFLGAVYSEMGKQIDSGDLKKIKEAIHSVADGNGTNTIYFINAIYGVTTNMTEIKNRFADNLSQILEYIHDINPEVRIILQTIPNPYGWIDLQPFSYMIELGISQLNQIINQQGEKGPYPVADVYAEFSKSDEPLSNASDSDRPMDPHPNAKGHKIIAHILERIYENR